MKEVVARTLQTLGRTDLQPDIRNEASNEIPVQCLDSAKAKKLLGWKPRYGFDEGLRMTIGWYKALLQAR